MSIEYDEDELLVSAIEAYSDNLEYGPNSARVGAIHSMVYELSQGLEFYAAQIGAYEVAERIFNENKEFIKCQANLLTDV